MIRLRYAYVLASCLVVLAGCTGGSVRVVLPDHHPANPLAAEAPFVPLPNPFAGIPLPEMPFRKEQPPVHRHEHQPGGMDKQMQMDDMQMDDEKSDDMMPGGHDGTGVKRGRDGND